MERKIAAAFEIRGVQETINDLAALEFELDAVNKKLREAKKTGDEDAFKGAKQSQEGLRNSIKETRKELRDQVSDFKKQKFPDDSLIGLRKRYSELRTEVQGLSKDQRESDFGQRLIKEAKSVKDEIVKVDQSIGDFTSNIGNYQSAFDGFGGLFSSISGGDIFGALDGFDDFTDKLQGAGGLAGQLGGRLAALGGPATIGIAAAGLAAFKLGSFIADTTLEFEKLRQQVGATTGAVGTEIDTITVRAKSFADVFGKDFNETVESANTLAKQFGISYDEAFDLIEKGTIAGADANGDFFNQIREYPAFFAEAGLSGEQFVNVITQQIQDGVFSDKGIDAIKEATIRLRELPQSTQDALNKIGFTSEEIRDIINEKGIGGAIQDVTKRLKTFEKDSEEVGVVLADVFGGAGEDAATDFIFSLDEIEAGLDGLTASTDAYTVRQAEQLRVQKEYNEELNTLSRQFEGVGTNLQNLGTGALTFLIGTLNDVVFATRGVFESFRNLANFEFDFVSGSELAARELAEQEQKVLEEKLKRKIAGIKDEEKIENERRAAAIKNATLTNKQLGELAKAGNASAIAELKKRGIAVEDATKDEKSAFEQLIDQQKAYKQAIEDAIVSGRDYSKEQENYLTVTSKITNITKELNKAIKETSDIEAGSVSQLKSRLSELNREINETTDENQLRDKIKEITDTEKELETVENKIEEIGQRLRGVFDNIEPLSSESFLNLDESTVLGDLNKRAGEERIESENRINSEIDALGKQRDERLKAERDAKFNEDLAAELEQAEKKKQIQEQITEASFQAAEIVAGALNEIRSNNLEKEISERQESLDQSLEAELEAADGNEAKQQEIRERYAVEQEALDARAANERKELARKEALINGALAITKVFATVPTPASFFQAALVAIQTAAQIATINSQEFADGGTVQAYENVNGTITQRANIPSTRRGDNVLIKAKAGEKILNKKQQRSLEGIAGANIWNRIKLPNTGRTSFVDGGTVPQIINPNDTLSNIQAAQKVDVNLTFSDSELDRLADKIGSRTSDGVRSGLNEANQENSRQERLKQRVG